MATPDQIPTDLTIDLDDDLSPEEFIVAVRNFVGYVDEITKSQQGDESGISWRMKVREGSVLVGIEPNPSAPPYKLSMIYNKAEQGVSAIARGDIAGADLSNKAVNHLKNLSDLVEKHRDGKGVSLWIKRKPVGINPGIAQIIREERKTDYHDIGTIEGRLEVIQDTAGILKIRVRDLLYPKPIDCVVPDQMIDDVLGSFRRRVEIEGLIHYRSDGTPISILTQMIDLLPEDADLPSADEVRGIMATA